MSTATPTPKCKRCGRMIFLNARGEWVLLSSRVAMPLCRDGKLHEPDWKPGDDRSGIVTGIAVAASVFDAGLI